MKIVIKGDGREIAALAVDIQEQKKECVIPELAPGMEVVTSADKSFHGLIFFFYFDVKQFFATDSHVVTI